jgi:hypothetical protein
MRTFAITYNQQKICDACMSSFLSCSQGNNKLSIRITMNVKFYQCHDDVQKQIPMGQKIYKLDRC